DRELRGAAACAAIDQMILRYDGLDAEKHEIDLYALGESLQGFARVTGTAAHFALTHDYKRYFRSQSLRILAKEPEANCFRVDLVFEFIRQYQILSGSFGTVVAALVPWLYIRATRKKDQSGSDELAKIAVEAMAAQNTEVTSRLLGTIEKMSEDLRPAMRQSTSPIAVSCETIGILTPERKHFLGRSDKDALLLPDADDLSDLMEFTVLITELDLERGTCKARFVGEPEDRRVPCKISDPLLETTKNPYSSAMDAGEPIVVKAKALFQDAKIVKLYISDVVI
ncbi:MAG: hypothetical protein ACREBW_07055, partial [Candidatus Micrarchaeaceae archaeon]